MALPAPRAHLTPSDAHNACHPPCSCRNAAQWAQRQATYKDSECPVNLRCLATERSAHGRHIWQTFATATGLALEQKNVLTSVTPMGVRLPGALSSRDQGGRSSLTIWFGTGSSSSEVN
eukprot:2551639-Amphidinium_carterae.3